MCRYCLSDDISIDSIENTLICLCKCKGTLKYTHFVCFRHWIDSKKKENDKFSKITQSCISYDFKSLICEVCREPIPHSVLINGQEAEILSIERPKKPMPYLSDTEARKSYTSLFWSLAVVKSVSAPILA